MMKSNVKLIAEKLISKTQSGQAIWTKTSRDSEFRLELTKSTITTDMWDDSESGLKWIDLCIYNVNGDTIEREAFGAHEPEEFNLLKKVYDLANENYYKIDETIKTIFDDLDGEDIVGDKDLPF